MTLDGYVDLPWRTAGRARDGLDCWGLVWLVYREMLGIELPSGAGLYTTAADRRENARIIAGGLPDWRQVPEDQAKPGDVVLMSRHGTACHVGLLARRGWLLHIREGLASYQVPVDRITREGYAVVGWFRHKERA